MGMADYCCNACFVIFKGEGFSKELFSRVDMLR